MQMSWLRPLKSHSTVSPAVASTRVVSHANPLGRDLVRLRFRSGSSGSVADSVTATGPA